MVVLQAGSGIVESLLRWIMVGMAWLLMRLDMRLQRVRNLMNDHQISWNAVIVLDKWGNGDVRSEDQSFLTEHKCLSHMIISSGANLAFPAP
jgi:hypothetical protein